MTNLERIRQMTEEELVKYLGTTVFCGKINVCRDKRGMCRKCIKKWLAEEEEGGGVNEEMDL